MGTLTDEDAPKLSRIELRKQKLAEYLLTKGRFKPPNPKPYLKESAVLKKPAGVMQRSEASGKGKENSASGETCVNKDVKMRDALTEKNKNTDTSKKEMRTLSKVPSGTLQRSTLKPVVSQTPMQHCRTLCKGTATVRNVSIKDQRTKPTVQTAVGTHKQSTTFKVTQESGIGQAETAHGICSVRAYASTAKTNQPKKPCVERKESYSDKVISRTQIKRPTAAEQLRSMASSRTEAKATTKAQTRVSQISTSKTGVAKPWGSHDLGKACSGTVKIDKPLVRNSQRGKGRSETQNESLSQTNEPGKKPGRTATQVPSTTEKQRSALFSKVNNAANVSKTTTVTAAGSKNALPRPCTTIKLPLNPAVHASVPQSFPQQSENSSNTKGTVQLKTPKTKFNPGTQGVRTVPLDGRKKSSAAQEERLRKLQEWRESRGITYKRPPMPVKPVRRKTTAALSQSYWTSIEQEDEVHGFVCAVDQSLNDCIKLLQQGFPVDQVRDVVTRLPMAKKFAKYWICQVRLMEREGNLDVLPTFEEAIRVVREPVDELRSVVFEILKKKEAKGSCFTPVQKEKEVHSEEEEKSHCDMQTPKPVGALIRGAKGESSVIKYKITATPGGKKSQQREKSQRVNGHEIRFFTPVRRSLRIEKTGPRYPAALQEQDPCVTSLQDLLTDGESGADGTRAADPPDSPLYVYRENEALKERVQIELVYEEAEVTSMKSKLTITIEGQLETKNGKYARIETKSTGVTIVAKQDQGNQSNVTVYRSCENDNNVCVAFCFKLRNKKYFPVVKKQGDSTTPAQFQVEPRNDANALDESVQFRWTKAKGVWKFLNSVAEPSQYLSVYKNQFTLTTTPTTHFRFKSNTRRNQMKRKKSV
ncbi:hypothetical protein AOLI_G00281240 [Acnodon oligacanthus]